MMFLVRAVLFLKIDLLYRKIKTILALLSKEIFSDMI